jgi:lipopolysaccharide export system protein LptA
MLERRIRWTSALVVATLLVIGCTVSSLAADGWSVESESGHGNLQIGEYTLTDAVFENVEEGIVVKCALVFWDMNNERAEFLDRVYVTQGGTVVEADSGYFDMKANKGSFAGSVSLLRPATDEEPYHTTLTCDELDLDSTTDSFVARQNAVMKRVGEDGKETILWASLVEYDGTDRLATLTDVTEVIAPGLREGTKLTAKTITLDTETERMEFVGLVLLMPRSEETEEAS